MKGSTTRLVCLLVVASSVTTVPFAAPASAQEQYPPSGTTLVLGVSEVRAGEPLAVSGTGCPILANVDIDLDRRRNTIGRTRADGEGSFATKVTIPRSTAPGDHTIIAGCGSLEFRTAIQVLGAGGRGGGGRGGGGIARTGAAWTMPLGFAGTALVSVGLAAVSAARRRRRGA